MTKLYIKQRKVNGVIRVEVPTPEEYNNINRIDNKMIVAIICWITILTVLLAHQI